MTGYIRYRLADTSEVELELHSIDQINERTQYDPSDVNAAFVTVSLTVTGYFSDTSASNFIAKTREIERILNTPRGELLIQTTDSAPSNEVFYHVTPDDTLDRDLDTGPKPRALSINRVIGNVGAWVTWTVEFSILRCGYTSSEQYPTLLYNTHSVNFEYAQDGRVVRTIEGEARLSDFTDLTLDQTGPMAQLAINAIYQTVPLGWRRISANYGISPNGLVLRYRFIDQENRNGWNDKLIELDIQWEESGRHFPTSGTLNVRMRGREDTTKSQMMLIAEALVRNRFRQAAPNAITEEYRYGEDMIENTVSISVTKRLIVDQQDIRENLDRESFISPTPAFGIVDRNVVTLTTTEGASNEGFDPILKLSQIGLRTNNLPILSRLVIRGLCDRAKVGTPPDYTQDVSAGGATITLEKIPQLITTPEVEGAPGGSEVFNDQVMRPGGYLEDTETVIIQYDQNVHVVGNANLVQVDEDGELQTDATVSQRMYQSRPPEFRVLVIGRAYRIGDPAEARPVPTIRLAGSNQNVKLALKRSDIRTLEPTTIEGGRAILYGTMWFYELTRDLAGTQFQVDPDTGVIDLIIPRRTTRASRIFTDLVTSNIQWTDPLTGLLA